MSRRAVDPDSSLPLAALLAPPHTLEVRGVTYRGARSWRWLIARPVARAMTSCNS
jgi:hypothetical protein